MKSYVTREVSHGRTDEANNQANTLPSEGRRREKLKKACADFESLLMYQLLQTMRKTIPEGGYLSGKTSWGDTYTMMFDQKVAEDLAKRGGGIGLQQMLFDQLGGIKREGGRD